MRKVLLPVDGSDFAFQAARYLIDFIEKHGPVEIHVVNVQPKPLEWQTHGIGKDAISDHLASVAQLSMQPVLDAFDDKNIAYQTHIMQGGVGDELVALAEEIGCDHIVMGTHGLGAISSLGSVTGKVLHLTNVPVICVKGESSH